LEKLLNDYGVDLVIWAHEHSYERLWPLYDYTVRNGSYEEPYRNPRAPVHLISGSAVSDTETKKFLLFGLHALLFYSLLESRGTADCSAFQVKLRGRKLRNQFCGTL
jgi:hypothetical protein